jgi:Ca-activated chloride channel family protein
MRSLARISIAALLVVAACGGGAAETTTTTVGPTTTTGATTTTEAVETSTTVAVAGDASFDFEGEVQAGTEVEISWTGPDNDGDYITIVEAGAAEGTYEQYFYTNAGSPETLLAPTTLGVYEVRYLDADGATVASSNLTVVARVITLEFSAEVDAGTEFDVTWTGIEARGDYITIVPAASPEGTYDQQYFYTADGPTGTLIAPMAEGDFEIRFASGLDGATMAASSIVIIPFDITLEAPAEVTAGSEFEVTWTGPNGPGDYLTIVPAGAAEGAYFEYAYTAEGNPLTLTAPEIPGAYEIRYRTGQISGAFGSIPITVG